MSSHKDWMETPVAFVEILLLLRNSPRDVWTIIPFAINSFINVSAGTAKRVVTPMIRIWIALRHTSRPNHAREPVSLHVFFVST